MVSTEVLYTYTYMTGRPGARFYALAQSYWDYVVTGLPLMWIVCDMVHSMRSYVMTDFIILLTGL